MRVLFFLSFFPLFVFYVAMNATQDRTSAFVELFENWCLPRVEDPARDWQSAYPDNGREFRKTYEADGEVLDSLTTHNRIYDDTGLSLEQEQYKCTVSDELPWLSDQERKAVLAKVSALMARRFPALLRTDDDTFGWDIHRVWSDGPAGTPAATWGVILAGDVEDRLPTLLILALPRP